MHISEGLAGKIRQANLQGLQIFVYVCELKYAVLTSI